MQNGKKILNELEFEQHISKLDDRGLIEFVARQQYDMSILCPIHSDKIKKLESRSRKQIGASGGAGAVSGGLVMGAIDYFLRRG